MCFVLGVDFFLRGLSPREYLFQSLFVCVRPDVGDVVARGWSCPKRDSGFSVSRDSYVNWRWPAFRVAPLWCWRGAHERSAIGAQVLSSAVREEDALGNGGGGAATKRWRRWCWLKRLFPAEKSSAPGIYARVIVRCNVASLSGRKKFVVDV